MSAPSNPPTLPGSAPPVLVGRERELGVLRQHLAAAIAGHGSLVLIGGEAGIGKTALAEMLCREATERGALILTGRCFDLAETPAYGPWLYLFERYRSSSGPPLPAAFSEPGQVGAVGSQAALFRQVLDFFKAAVAERPAIVVLEDQHWSDSASLDLLRFITQSIAALPLLILLTYRSDELTRRHPLYHLLPAFVREAGAVRLDLHPLDDVAMKMLVTTRYHLGDADTARLIAHLRERAEGNALFLDELLRSLEEKGALRREDDQWLLGDIGGMTVPSLLRQVIDARISRLGAESQRLLAIAAVIGSEVGYSLWTTVGEVDEETLLVAIGEAEAAHVMVERRDGSGASFTHALIRETLYEGISPARRRRLHRRVAEHLTARSQPDPDAVAMHFQRATDGRAVAWLVRAGERAQRAYAWITAAARYEAALALLEGSDEESGERGWLGYRIARLRRFSAPAQGVEYLDEALRIAALVGDRALAAAARFSRGLCAFNLDDIDAAISDMRAGCDALETLPLDEQMRLDLGPDADGVPTVTNPRGFLVWTLACAGRLADALAMGEATRAGRPTATPLGELGVSHYGDRDAALGYIYALLGRPDEAREAHRRARAAFRAFGHYSTLAMSATQELLFSSLPYRTEYRGEHDRLVEEVEAAEARASAARVNLLPARLPMLALMGRWEEARVGALAAAQGEQAELGREVSRSVLGALARARGEADEAWAQVRQVFPRGAAVRPSADFVTGALAMQRLAVGLALDADDMTGAKDWLEAHNGLLAESGAVLGQSERYALWAQYRRRTGDMARADENAQSALACATEPRQPLALLAAHRILGELATETGRYDDASRHLNASLALADACAIPYERALTLLAVAELRAAGGKRDEAEQLLDEVRAICTPLGARPALARADALAVRLAALRDAAPAYPAGLSAREVEVLRLVAAGRTNRDIADALFLSEHTVRVHVRNILTKTDTDNRTAAAAFARQHRLA